jgi:hypothetical protein
MNLIIALVATVIYVLALFYLLIGTLGFSIRIGSSIYAEEGFGILRTAYLILLVLLICGGSYFIWRIFHRPT